HVVVDAPKTQARNLVPTVLALTSRTLYVRFHGRNAATWNKRGGSAAERFDYLYSDEELREWSRALRRSAEEAEQAFAMFNNNGRSPAPPGLGEREFVAQAPLNALTFKALLDEGGRG
ncbi:MAG: DUF72 domain-containing protein, partial [Thermoleophilia bacterium]|nr:DUF72 domain-containing protein [Thermoleophilia bacterium]